MLKKRIIPTLLLKSERLVKGKQFQDYRDVGDPSSVIKIYTNQYADELVLINIGNGSEDFLFLLKIIEKASENCFIPLSVGGGINSLEKVKNLIFCGADRVLITSAASEDPEFILKASEMFGRQSIIGGIDILEQNDEIFIVYGKKRERVNMKLENYIKKLDDLGVGEILINFISRDGLMKGTNIEFLKKISDYTNSPFMTLGGVGNVQNIKDIFDNTNCDAVCCASLFHFGDNNPIRIRSYLRNHQIFQRTIK